MDRELVTLLTTGLKTRRKLVIEQEQTHGALLAAQALKDLSGRINFRKRGLCSVFPIRHTHVNMAVEVTGADASDFAFLAGVITALRGTLKVEEPAFRPTREWAAKLTEGANGYLVVGAPAKGVVCASGVFNPRTYRIGPKCDPAYFTGVAAGSLLRRRDTFFRFSTYVVPDALKEGLELLSAGGAEWLPLTDGVRILGWGRESENGETVCG